MNNALPNLKFEQDLWKKGFIVIGVDEVGRGAFAGPLVVGGVVFTPTTNDARLANLLSFGINDSKKLKPRQRELLAKIIQKESLACYVSKIDIDIINRIGIGKATFMAMRDVVKHLREKLPEKKIFVLVDAFYVKRLNGVGREHQKGIIHGDTISLSIAAASIIAKVHRDRVMRNYSRKYPGYLLGRNKGYGSLAHRLAIQKHGVTRLHRKQFVRNLLTPLPASQGDALQGCKASPCKHLQTTIRARS